VERLASFHLMQISVITAWPSIGVAIMETVILNSTPANVRPFLMHVLMPDSSVKSHPDALSSQMKRQEDLFLENREEADRIKANNSAFVERMKANVARSAE
jgi:hypothetical protein